MDSWYKNKFEDITKKTSRHVDKVRSIREEMASAKKDVSIISENENMKTYLNAYNQAKMSQDPK